MRGHHVPSRTELRRSIRSSSTIQPCPPVRLEWSCGLIFQYLVASVNSASTSWPLRNSAFAPFPTSGSAKPMSWCSGATARAVTQSTGSGDSIHNIPDVSEVHGTCRRWSREPPRAGTPPSWRCVRPDGYWRPAFPPTRRPARRRENRHRCRDRPRLLADGAEHQKLQRIGDMPGPEIWKRRRRHEIGFRLPFPQQSRHSDPAAPLFHVKRG